MNATVHTVPVSCGDHYMFSCK